MSDDPLVTQFSALFNQLKHLRCREPVPDCVIDVRSPDFQHDIEPFDVEFDTKTYEEERGVFEESGVSDPNTWQPVVLKSLGSGIVVVPGVVVPDSCAGWFDMLLRDYPQREGFRSNIGDCPVAEKSDEIPDNLRWLTFGYHYLWTPKVYDFDHPDPVPVELHRLFKLLSRIIGIDFRPEAGIINYYTCKSRLSPHADVSEVAQDAPLFSLSFGGPAIFIVGGSKREDLPVVPILLRDGDLVIMQSDRRLSFHAVPKIYCPPSRNECTGISRININARQVFR